MGGRVIGVCIACVQGKDREWGGGVEGEQNVEKYHA